MMDEILLTPEEREVDLVWPDGLKNAMRHRDECLCRAQMRKVVEWLDTICTDESHPFSMPDFYGDTPRYACRDCMQALREAAGEGK